MACVLALLCYLPLGATAPLPEPAKPQPGEWKFNLRDPKPRLGLEFGDNMRFGLVMSGVPDPRPEYKEKFKKLTYWEDGQSNNTIVKINGAEHYFGRINRQNRWAENGSRKTVKLPGSRIGAISAMDFTVEKVLVTQHVEIVPSASGLLDTCLIYYTVKNYSEVTQKVGLRIMLDTFIGANDGVPFLIPGERGFLTTMREFPQKNIPDYVEVVENPNDLKDLGTVARLQLRGVRLPGIDLEDIERLRICRWPQNKDIRWAWEMEPINHDPDQPDSCVAAYWAYQEMKPNEERRMAITYGLGRIDLASRPEPKPGECAVALSVPHSARINGEFVVTAYLWNTKPGQKVELKFLDKGLSLVADDAAEKLVENPGASRTQVSWRVKGNAKGEFGVEATSGDTTSRPRTVKVGIVYIFE